MIQILNVDCMFGIIAHDRRKRIFWITFFSLFVLENQVKYTIIIFHHCACIFFRFGSSLIITTLSLSFLLLIECYQLNSTLNFFSSSPFLPTTTLLLSLSSLSKIYILFLFYHKENSLSLSLSLSTQRPWSTYPMNPLQELVRSYPIRHNSLVLRDPLALPISRCYPMCPTQDSCNHRIHRREVVPVSMQRPM